jgi:hypothetical protein
MQRRSPPRLSASLPEPTQGQADTDVQGLRSSNSKVSLELPQLRFRDSFEGRVIVAGAMRVSLFVLLIPIAKFIYSLALSELR